MSTLTSASTLAQVQAAYADNASYVEDNSVAKCRAFITACTILLLKLPAEQGTREAQLRLNVRPGPEADGAGPDVAGEPRHRRERLDAA